LTAGGSPPYLRRVLEPRAIVDGLFRHTADGPRLLAGRCERCARLHFPATPHCPHCAGGTAREATVGPAGHLLLYTAISSRPPAYRGPLPYGFGVVALDDADLRVITRLTEPDPAQLRPGLPVRLVLEPLFADDDGRPVLSYAFAPVA
jgi:uncharacterized OB-fold protein